MGKYIDADRLQAEIEFSKSVYSNPRRVVHGVADAFEQDGRVAMCDDILKKLNSLKQEQNEDLIQGWKDKAVLYANEHAKGKDTWVRDALYVAYISAIQDTLKIRII